MVESKKNDNIRLTKSTLRHYDVRSILSVNAITWIVRGARGSAMCILGLTRAAQVETAVQSVRDSIMSNNGGNKAEKSGQCKPT